MIQIIASIIGLLIFTGLTVLSSYEYGYEKREEMFQDNPIQWVQGGVPVVHISREKGKIIITEQEPKLIEYNK